jgi:hypothetical protein
MDIKEEVNGITNKVITEKLPGIVEEKVTKMITSVVDDLFRSYGDIAKDVKEKIEKEIDVNLQEYKMLDYNALIAKTINETLLNEVNESCLEPIKSMIKDTVGHIDRKEIKYSEICNMVLEAAMEDSCDNEGEISFHAIKDDRHDWTTISYDFEADIEPRRCQTEILISGSRGTIFIFRTKTNWDAKGEVNPKMMVNMNKLEQNIFRLYAGQVKIIEDNNFENYWSKNEY